MYGIGRKLLLREKGVRKKCGGCGLRIVAWALGNLVYDLEKEEKNVSRF